jgi:hypothetical protein
VHFGGISGRLLAVFESRFPSWKIWKCVMAFGHAVGLWVPKGHVRLRPQSPATRASRDIWRDGIMGEVRPFAAILMLPDFDDDLSNPTH